MRDKTADAIDAVEKLLSEPVASDKPNDGWFTREDLMKHTGRSADWCCRKLNDLVDRGVLERREVRRRDCEKRVRWKQGYRLARKTG